jgi:hypothetical protein
MNRTLAVMAAAVCLGAGAVGCSSGGKTTSSTPSSPAAPTPASNAAAPSQGCNAATLKEATRLLDEKKDTMNQTLPSGSAGTEITKITSDDSCYLVVETNAKSSDAQAKQEFQALGRGMSGVLPSSGASTIKGVKIVAADNSVLYEKAAAK